MGKNEGKQKDTGKLVRILLLNVVFVLFGLCAIGSGTYAWFANGRSASVEAGAFTIEAPTGIQFDLYYLDFFYNPSTYDPGDPDAVKQYDGNQNSLTNEYSGYAYGTTGAKFHKVENADPMTITQLWPAHKLTFAIVLSSSSAFTLILDDWGEATPTESTPKVGADTYVSLTWAIDIFGGAYSVGTSGQLDAALSMGYASYHQATKTDVFNAKQTYGEGEEAPQKGLTVVNSSGISGSGDYCIAYFTVEFSNASSTFYSKGPDDVYYTKDAYGDSNCYEGLSMTTLSFSLR